MAQRAALAALDDEAHVTDQSSLNQTEMDKVRHGIADGLGLRRCRARRTFVYFDVGRDGREVFDALLREGIIVRHIEGRMLRVTIGLPEENQLFLSALQKVTRTSR